MDIYSFQCFGYEGAVISVEVDLRRGIPAVDFVGLADSQLKESRERMIEAVKNSGFELPSGRVLISLSPADIKKDGSVFDLPMALAVLAKANNGLCSAGDAFVMGELEPSGKLSPAKGVHAACATAISCGINLAIVPKENADEAREIDGMRVCGAETLNDAFSALGNIGCFTLKVPESDGNTGGVTFSDFAKEYEFAEIKDANLVRALQIAAAGGHSVIATGAPGCEKTKAMQKFPSLLPDLTKDEAQSVARVWSLAGLLNSNEPTMKRPPFRMPHQSATLEEIMGGGVHCHPGEISLAHNGVLFLDDAREFRASVLQSLRIPMENRRITLSRAGRSTVYPASFQLLMAANPCPCGNYGSEGRICFCSRSAIENYWKNFSYPLLDRIDIRVKLDGKPHGEPKSTEELRKDIAKAIRIQRDRQGKRNAKLSSEEIDKFCAMTQEAADYIETVKTKACFSLRAIESIRKTARTIADMDEKETIELRHIEEAVLFRKPFDFLNRPILETQMNKSNSKRKTVTVKNDWRDEFVDEDGNWRNKTFKKGTEYYEFDEPEWLDSREYPPEEYVYIQSKSSRWGAEWAISKDAFEKHFERKK